MDWSNILAEVVFALYSLGVVSYLAGVVGRRPALQRMANGCAMTGFGAHTILLAKALAASQGMLQTHFYFSLLAWSLLLIFFILWWRLKMEFLSLIASPLALALFASSMAISNVEIKLPGMLSGLFFGLHIGTLFMSIGLMAMAFGSGVTFIWLERKIKTKAKLTGFRKDLPSLSVFDRANHLAVVYGFPLFTLGLLSGFLWARFTWGRLFSWDPKEIITLVIWLMFAFLFHQRLAIGWKGRKPAWLAIWVFSFTVISLVGINFLLPTHHSFSFRP